MNRWCSWKLKRIAWANAANSAGVITAGVGSVWDGEGRWDSLCGTRLFFRVK